MTDKWTRTDEKGNPCPGTLGEYLDLVEALAPESAATAFIKKKIRDSEIGRNEVVSAPDSQMRALLMPMMLSLDFGQYDD